MDIQTYLQTSTRTMNNDLTSDEALDNCCLGLVGEAGELNELIKKHRYHSVAWDDAKLVKELGDVMFYWAWACRLVGFMPPTGWNDARALEEDTSPLSDRVSILASHCSQLDRTLREKQDDASPLLRLVLCDVIHLGRRANVSIGTILDENERKLRIRYPGKFNPTDAAAKADEAKS